MTAKKKFEEQLEEVLIEIEELLFDRDATIHGIPEYSVHTLRAATKIFSEILLSHMWHLQVSENIEKPSRLAMATKAGKDIKTLIHVYTGLESTKFYKKDNDD